MKKVLFSLLFASASAVAQNVASSKEGSPPLVNYTDQQIKENMMQQLGIKRMRPGYSGNESDPNHANYDESAANPCPTLPDALTLKNGKKVSNADDWWNKRRPELAEDIEREMYGRIPKNVPKVTWTVKIIDKELVGRIPVVAKQLIGHVDNTE